ncbi:MAG: TolC family protein [Polyangiaceae bacterium]|nr:TolC family protein [Polyangiaceae bacterium]
MSRKVREFGRTGALALVISSLSGVAAAQPAAEPPGGDVAAPPGEPAGAAPPAAESPAAMPASAVAAGGDALAARFDEILGRPGGLTADQAGERAAATSPDAGACAKDVEIARYDVDRAVSGFLPEVTLLARYTRQSPVDNGSIGPGSGALVGTAPAADADGDGIIDTDADGTIQAPLFTVPMDSFSFPVLLNQYLLQASLNVPISDYVFRTRFGVAAARGNERAARLSEQAARLQAAANARLLYFDWVRAKLQLVVTEQSLLQSREQRRLAQKSLEGGRISRVDVLRAEAQVASAELMVSQAQHLVTLSEDRLRTAMHEPNEGPLSVGDRLSEGPSPDARRGFEQLYAEATSKRLELRAIDASASALRDAGRSLRADELPRLSAFANGYYTNPNQRVFPQEDKFTPSWDAGVELSWTPTRIGGARAEARKYAAQAAQRETDIQSTRDALRTEVMAAHQGIKEAALNIETAQRGLTSAEEGYRVRQLLLQHGRATSVEVTDAETVLLRARLALVNARVDLVAAQLRLDHAVGRDVK